MPGVTTLTRLIASIRERVAERLWQRLSKVCSPEQRTDLEGLLARAGVSRITNLERLRRVPSRASAPVLVQALARLTEVRQLDVGPLDVLDMLIRDLLARSTNAGKKARLRTLRDLDAAALSRGFDQRASHHPEWTDEQVRIFLTEQQAKITEAVTTIYELARPADDNYYQEFLTAS